MILPYKKLLNLLPDTVVIVNDKAVIVWVSNNITNLLGYMPNELIGEPIEVLVPKRVKEKHVKLRDSFIQKPKKRPLFNNNGLWAKHKNDKEIPVNIELNHYKESDSKYILCSIRVLTEKELITKTLQDLHERLELSQSLANVGSWDWDIINEKLTWTREVYRIFGVDEYAFEVTYDDFISFIYDEDKNKVIDAISNAIKNQSTYSVKHRIIRPSGEVRYLLEKGEVVSDVNGKPLRMVGAVLDITSLQQREIMLEKAALFDEVTQLPNRLSCRQEIEVRIAHALFYNKAFAVLYIDLDNFKNINDTQGHLVGDDYLYEVSRKLSKLIFANVFLSRLGGDEFILVTDFYCEADLEIKANILAKEVISLLNIKKHFQDIVIDLSASVGIAFYPIHGISYTELLSSADKAMYQAKNTGRNNYIIYSSSLEQQRRNELQLISDIRQGLKENQFSVHYQAKQCLKTSELIGCEALIRWEHPKKGNISPLKFIPIAEKVGLIKSLEKFVLEQSCLFLKQWQTLTSKPFTLSINVSAIQLGNSDFVSNISKGLKEAGINADCIELELTESMLMENLEDAMAKLNEIRSLGIHTSIDDFGTGYSSLSYLQKLPIDIIKIDKSFVDKLCSSETNVWILKSIISLATGLNLKTVAEGVETEEQKAILKELGCDILQGYLFSKPIPKDLFFSNFAIIKNQRGSS
tara:strand:- start:489 stop:2570 length:2082 start_codon:yes stop_codon:yes gene_type:complete